ncbi:MAG TPA: histidine kinase [Saprospiraceae bacterium]|nr:histidine kinase [Saprospiraceae bacterium]
MAWALVWSAGNTMIYLIAVNINWYLLLPKFMLKQSFVGYIALLVALSLLLSPFSTLFNLWIFRDFQGAYPKSLTLPHFHFINLLILTALSSLVRIPLDWFKMQAEKNELVTKNIETELQSLKNQINPHFLFNTLNNLYALTLKKSDLAPEVVLKLSDMMRYMLYECNEKEVSVAKEFGYIHNYMELEKLRYSAQADISMTISEELMEHKVAPLLLIPFVENSFKHGLSASMEDAYIRIESYKEKDHLVFRVTNSKPQNLPGQVHQRKHGGVGLANVRKRLQLIYPDRHQLTIADEPNSYSIQLIISLNDPNYDQDTDR